MRVDDALDLFAEHAVGGIIGLLFNAFFATSAVISLDGVNTSINGGWLDHNWKQLYIQVAYICAVCAYSFCVTALIAKGIDMVPGLHIRASGEAESLGMDEDQVLPSSITTPLSFSHLLTSALSDRRIRQRLH